jgi:AcrR family transcriptional regulator
VAPRPNMSKVPDRIIQAAIALFSRQGYHGTSTREIARVADVSEVTVYRYFDHKEDIFWSALSASFNSIKPRLDSVNAALKWQPPDLVLPKIFGLLSDAAMFSPELPRLIAVAFFEHHVKAEDVCHQHLDPLFNAIVDHLATSIKAGKLRKLDPTMVTAAITLTVIAQPELSKLSDSSRRTPLSGREAIDEYSNFWMSVLEPD